MTALACGHRMCRPGSDECKARDALQAELNQRADRMLSTVKPGPLLAEVLAGRPLYVQSPHGPGCTVADPCTECRPTRRIVVAPVGADNDTGRPVVFTAPQDGQLYVSPVNSSAPVLLAELLGLLIEDARQQLDQVTGTAALAYAECSDPAHLTELAIAEWHHNNPGLSRLLDLTKPETTEGS